ncbi:MAG: hypothetical protein V4858_17135 [Pseudomonadota bacterium]
MKEELQGKLMEILTSMQTAAGKASDFAMEQLPEIAQSYVAYGRIYETAYTAVFLLLLVAALTVALRFGYFNKSAVERGGWTEGRVGAAVGGTGASFVFLVVVLVNLDRLFLVWLAPKVWLLKEIARMVR